MKLDNLYRDIEALGGAVMMDGYDEGYTDGLNDALAILRKYGFGVDLAPSVVATEAEIDRHLDNVLRASGSALRHYSMHSTKTAMRAAMAEAMLAGRKEPHDHTTPDR